MTLMMMAVGLAAWRVTVMLNRETGPWGVFVRFRQLFGFTHDAEGNVISWPDTMLAKLISCAFCLSVWCAAAMYGAWRVEPVIVLVIAAMGIAALIERWVSK